MTLGAFIYAKFKKEKKKEPNKEGYSEKFTEEFELDTYQIKIIKAFSIQQDDE